MESQELVLSFDDCLFMLGALRQYKNQLCRMREKSLYDGSSESFLTYLRDELSDCDRVYYKLLDVLS